MPTTRGPLPPAVYWRRRVFVTGTVLALVLLAVNVLRGGEPAAPGESAVVVAGQPTAAATDQTRETTGKRKNKARNKNKNGGTSSPDTSPAPDVQYTPPPEPEPAEPTGACADSDISVVPSVTAAVAGQPVTIRLSLRTVSAEACTWRTGRYHLALKVTDADEDDVWSTRECPRLVPTTSVVVRRALTSTLDFPWNARTSTPGCPVGSAWAEPGQYAVQVAGFGGEPSPVVTFSLLDPDDVFVPEVPLGPDVPSAADDEPGKNKGKSKNKGKNKPDGAVEPDRTRG